MRQPGIVSLHAVTSTNALHYAYQNSADDETRKLLLLQTAAFLTLFRGNAGGGKGVKIDLLEPLPLNTKGARAVEEIFAQSAGRACGRLPRAAHEEPGGAERAGGFPAACARRNRADPTHLFRVDGGEPSLVRGEIHYLR